jgi:lipid-A-disaccharide synthase
MASVVTHFPDHTFAVAAIKNMNQELYAPLIGIPNVHFVEEDTYNLLQNSIAAVVTSGTATLETALFKVPQVVVYRTSGFSYFIAKSLIKVPYISLVNLIADKPAVRELIQGDLSAENLISEITGLLAGTKREQMLRDYDTIWRTLDTGSASETAAKLMVGYLVEKK